jgi:hypothetical protein
MTITNLELGEMYYTKGGTLERRFLGSTIYTAQQILNGGVVGASPTQSGWANALAGEDFAGHTTEARKAFEWGLINNPTFQGAGESLPDGDMNWIVAEYAKTYVAA